MDSDLGFVPHNQVSLLIFRSILCSQVLYTKSLTLNQVSLKFVLFFCSLALKLGLIVIFET